MKKVLIISSSPRRAGNSDILCDRFMAGAEHSGNQVEKVFLRDYNVAFCTGCGHCANANAACILKDDADTIVQKMVQADVIVLATPVYFYSMSGQMKTLIDRCCARYTQINNKEFYYIMTAAEQSKKMMNPVIEGFKGFLDCLHNPTLRATIYGLGAWQVGDIKSLPAMEEAYNIGSQIE